MPAFLGFHLTTVNRQTVLNLNTKLIYALLLVQTLLTPLIANPSGSSESFKFQFFIFLGLLNFLLILINILFSFQFRFLVSPLTLPLLLNLAAATLATVFSPHFYTAIFGANDRFTNTLLVYLILFINISFISTFLTLKYSLRLIKGVIISVSFISFVYLLSFFSSQLPFLQILTSGKLTFLTYPNYLASLISLIYPLLIYFLIKGNNGLSRSFLIYFPCLFITTLSLALVNFFPATVIVVFEFILLVGLNFRKKSVLYSLLALFLLFFFSHLSLNNLPKKDPLINENVLPLQISYFVANRSFFASPVNLLFGSGLGSFSSQFTKFRPAILNDTQLSEARFTKSGWEIFDILTETGLVGLVALLFLGFQIIRLWFQKSRKDDLFNSCLGVSLTGGLMTLLTTNVSLTYVLILAILVGTLLTNIKGETNLRFERKIIRLSSIHSLGYILSVCLFLLSLFMVYHLFSDFRASLKLAQAQTANSSGNYELSYRLTEQAVLLNPHRDSHHVNLSKAAFLYAQSQRSELIQLNYQDQEKIQKLLIRSVQEASLAAGYNAQSSATNSENVSNWENLAVLYSLLSNDIEGADKQAQIALKKAAELDPTNPNIFLALGDINLSLGNKEEAKGYYEKALKLFSSENTKTREIQAKINNEY